MSSLIGPMRVASAPSRHSASICSRLGICIAAPKKTASNTFFPCVLGKLPSFGQSAHQIRKAKHLVEISLEPVPVPAQKLGDLSFSLSFSLRNRCRFTLQMVAAAASKRWRIAIFLRTVSTHGVGMLETSSACRPPVREILILHVQAFAIGAMTGGPTTGPLAFDKRAGQHFPEQTEAADELAAQFQVGFVG